MRRYERERICAYGRRYRVDIRALVITCWRPAGQRARLVGLGLSKVSLFGSRGIS